MSEIASPCMRNCCLDGRDICVGCFRSLTEIMQWREVDEQGKLTIITTAQERQKTDQEKRLKVVK